MASVTTSPSVGVNGKASNGPGGNGAAPVDARLAGQSGVGTLRVWRGQHGQVLGYAGSWRLELSETNGVASLDALRAAHADGRTVRFQGSLDDPGKGEAGAVDAEVRISSIGTYQYQLSPGDPNSKTVDVTLVNFIPVQDPVAS